MERYHSYERFRAIIYYTNHIYKLKNQVYTSSHPSRCLLNVGDRTGSGISTWFCYKLLSCWTRILHQLIFDLIYFVLRFSVILKSQNISLQDVFFNKFVFMTSSFHTSSHESFIALWDRLIYFAISSVVLSFCKLQCLNISFYQFNQLTSTNWKHVFFFCNGELQDNSQILAQMDITQLPTMLNRC